MESRLSPHALAIGSIAVSALVLGLKLLAWWLTGSIALYSDAMESLVNVGGAALAWLAVRYASRPPDPEHPFGHHKAEYFSAVAEGIMIILAAVLILREAALAFADLGRVNLVPAGLLVNALAMVANLAWARMLIVHGRRHRSPALVASGRHLMTDVWTSVGVLAGLVLARQTGWAVLDPILALIVAANILREGFRVVATSMSGLMDRAASSEEQRLIEDIVHRSGSGALQIHDIKTRRAAQALFVEFHLVVDSEMSVRASHEICDAIEAALRRELPAAKVTIHVEPEHKLKAEGIRPA